MMVPKKLIRGHYFTFLGNYGTRRAAERSRKQHLKEWGGFTAITVGTIGVPPRKRYLLWHRNRGH